MDQVKQLALPTMSCNDLIRKKARDTTLLPQFKLAENGCSNMSKTLDLTVHDYA